jgi:hypothetical protein
MHSTSFAHLVLMLALGHARWAQDRDHVLPGPDEVRWYAGDTHEHFQGCFVPAQPLDEILQRLEDEDLNVGTVLVWNPGANLPYSAFACLVNGTVDPLSQPDRVLQYGVETSGLDCGKWGHLSGMGIGPEEARFVTSSLASGDCADAPGLVPACGGDGSGLLAAPVAQLFHQAPGAICGYAHAIWPRENYFVNGFPWFQELVASGFTRDARCIDPAQRLALPNLTRLLFDQNPLQRAFFPLLGAADAALGDVDFLETITLGPAFPYPFRPESHWDGLSYRLASLGLRVAQAAGSDQDCALVPPDHFPRTYVWLDEPFSYQAWTRGLVAGQTSIGIPGLRIDLRVNSKRVGENVHVASGAELRATVEVESAGPLEEEVELLVDGEVFATQPLVFDGGRARFAFGDLQVPASSWLCARLSSQRAVTGPLYVYVDGQPISDCLAAEYWMLWSDILAKVVLQVPQLQLFGCQRNEALARLARARRVFKTYRDIEELDPSFAAARYGRSTPGAFGPISIGTMERATSHQSLLLTCVNAPPLAEGTLYLSRVQDATGTCAGDVRFLVGTAPQQLIASFPAQSTRSGFAEVLVPAVPHGEEALYAQFVWDNPPGRPGLACGAGPAERSASDALALAVEVPPLTTISITPAVASLARGTSMTLVATGLFVDGSKHDLSGVVRWVSTQPEVAGVENAPGTPGLVTALAVGTTQVLALDEDSGHLGLATVNVTPAVLESLEVSPPSLSLALGFDQSLLAIGTFSDDTVQDVTALVAWSSSAPDVASVGSTGKLAGLVETLSVGTTTLSALDPATGVQASALLTVTPAVLTEIQVTPPSAVLPLGTSQVFGATGHFSDGTTLDLSSMVSWSSSVPLVALVTATPEGGLATSVTVGTTVITAELAGLTGSAQLEVSPAALVGLELTPPLAAVPLGYAQAFLATGIYTDGSSMDLTAAVTWSSSVPGVAVLSNAAGSEGLATSLAVGTTQVAALEPDSGASASATLEVTPAVLTEVELAPDQASLALGFALTFSARGTYSDGSELDLSSMLTWSSSDPAVAAISNAPGNEGRATSASLGTTEIRATDPASQVFGATTLTVTPAVLTTLEVLPASPSAALGLPVPFTARGTYSDGTTQDLGAGVTWSSSEPAVAVVSNAAGSEGLATTLALGTTMITALDPGTLVAGSTVLTVTPAVLMTIDMAPLEAEVGLGTATSFSATGTYSDGASADLTALVTWSSSDPAVASISNAAGSEGVATALGFGTTTISALEPTSGLGAATTLRVLAVLQTLTVLPANPSILEGRTRAFTATGTYDDGSSADLTTTVAWSTSNPAVASFSTLPGQEGLALGHLPGLVTVFATDPATGVAGTTTLRVVAKP